MVFAFWSALLLTHLWAYIPPVKWESVSGYFTWAVMAFVPAVVPYLTNKWLEKQKESSNVSVSIDSGSPDPERSVASTVGFKESGSVDTVGVVSGPGLDARPTG